MGSMSRDLCYFTNPPNYGVDGLLKSGLEAWLEIEQVKSGEQINQSRNIYGRSARFKSNYHRDFLKKKPKPRLRFMAYKLENVTNG